MEKINISIIIPVYNAEKYLYETIKSFEMNEQKNVELICVDDGSTDSSYEILKSFSYLKNYSVIQADHKGASNARNIGISLAKGEYIWFFDSDDIMEFNSIQKYKSIISKRKPDLIISNYTKLTTNQIEKKNVCFKRQRCAKFTSNELLYTYLIDPIPGNKLYKKSIIDEYSIRFANVKIGQDLNFFLKYISKAKSIVYFNVNIMTYRIVNGSISRSYDDRILDIVKSINDAKKYYSTEYKKCKYRYYLIAGYKHFVYQLSKLSNVKNLALRNSMKKTLICNILEIRNKIHCKSFYEYYRKIKLDKELIFNLLKLSGVKERIDGFLTFIKRISITINERSII